MREMGRGDRQSFFLKIASVQDPFHGKLPVLQRFINRKRGRHRQDNMLLLPDPPLKQKRVLGIRINAKIHDSGLKRFRQIIRIGLERNDMDPSGKRLEITDQVRKHISAEIGRRPDPEGTLLCRCQFRAAFPEFFLHLHHLRDSHKHAVHT